mmetsp:Transcript_16648/g.39520  ORF Transcript_16648/g.39520 Transcript_16648/m.39520 type:complete len:938 (-) Transcript_16648:724-3537(-)
MSARYHEELMFPGQVEGRSEELLTLDVCSADSDSFQSFPISQNWLKNLSRFQPWSIEYYVKQVLPRILPWAAPLLGLTLILIVVFVLWRWVYCCARHCCPSCCGSCCNPSASPHEVLAGRSYRLLQAVITVLLLGAVGAGIWGCIVASEDISGQLWSSLQEISGFVNSSLGTVADGIRYVDQALQQGILLATDLRGHISKANISGLVTCMERSSATLPPVIDDLFQSLQKLNGDLFRLPVVASSSIGVLDQLVNVYMVSVISSAAVLGGSQFQPRLFQAVGDSLSAYGRLPSDASSAEEPTQEVLDANNALAIGDTILEVQRVILAVGTLREVIDSRVPEQVSANLTLLANAFAELENSTLWMRETGGALNESASDTVSCFTTGLDSAYDINKTAVKFSHEANEAFELVESTVEPFQDSCIINMRLINGLQALKMPAILEELKERIEILEGLTKQLTAEELTNALSYLDGNGSGGGLIRLLRAVREPISESNRMAEVFLAMPGPATYSDFRATWGPAIAALSGLRRVATDNRARDTATTFHKAAVIGNILEDMNTTELNGLLDGMRATLGASELENLKGLAAQLNATLALMREGINGGIMGGVERIENLLDTLSVAVTDFNETVKDARTRVSNGLRRASRALDAANATVGEVCTDLASWREPVAFYDDIRRYVSYAIFGICCLASVMVIFGVLFAIPFLYNGFTLVLLVMLALMLAALFVPSGTVVIVGSDGCNLMEEMALERVNGIRIDSEQKAVVNSVLKHYLFGTDGPSFTSLVENVTGVNILQVGDGIKQWKGTLATGLNGFELRGNNNRTLQEMLLFAEQAVGSAKVLSAELGAERVNELYVSAKSFPCCTVMGILSMQWLAGLVTACLVLAAVLLVMIYIGRLDALPNKDVDCVGCGCFCHRVDDKSPSDQFIYGGSGRPQVGSQTPKACL